MNDSAGPSSLVEDQKSHRFTRGKSEHEMNLDQSIAIAYTMDWMLWRPSLNTFRQDAACSWFSHRLCILPLSL